MSYKTPGIMQTNFWSEKKKIENTMFSPDKSKVDIDLLFMDITQLHEFSDEG